MAVKHTIDVSSADLELLQALVRHFLPGVAVWAYGSRVKGTARANSDLDVAVFAPLDMKREFGDLREALEESRLPFKVDLFRWDDIPDKFKRLIEEQYVIVQ